MILQRDFSLWLHGAKRKQKSKRIAKHSNGAHEQDRQHKSTFHLMRCCPVCQTRVPAAVRTNDLPTRPGRLLNLVLWRMYISTASYSADLIRVDYSSVFGNSIRTNICTCHLQALAITACHRTTVESYTIYAVCVQHESLAEGYVSR